MWRRRFLAGSLIAGCVLSTPALAQTEASPGALVYEPSYFSAYSPRTALDMVARVPGFTIDEGEERRGFAGAQGNVLIDGAPPASKSQEIDDILSRIPASDVERIELIRGSGSNAGSAQGARINVVRRPSSGDGVWEATAARAADGRISPGAEAAWSGRLRDLEYGLSATYDVTRLPIRGSQLEYDASGALDERRDERLPSDEREGRLIGELSAPWLGGAASVDAQLSRVEFDERTNAALLDGAGAAAGAVFGNLEERETIGEIGASLRHTLGAWQTDLGAVVTRRRFEADETSEEFEADGGLDEAAVQTQRIDSGETIIRVAAERALGGRWRLEFGAEAALNTLEQRLTLSEDEGAGPAPVLLPSANVRVEERRAEVSAMVAGAPSAGWTVEAGAAFETSSLTQSGDAERETELNFWKPSLQFTRAFGERNQVRLRLFRDVGQLDFEDFVSAADLTSSVIDAGNPSLRPETSWRLEATADWRFGEGALSLTGFHWWIEDAFDLVPIGPPGDQLDAPGNIGDATAYGVRAALALPLPLSAELRIDAVLQRSDVTDPLTGARRSISEFEESALTIALRQDLADWAWGIDYERENEAPSYRLDRVERERDAEDLTLWIETTAFGGVKLRAWAANLTDSAERRTRRHFDPDRLAGFDGADLRERREGVTLGIRASGDF